MRTNLCLSLPMATKCLYEKNFPNETEFKISLKTYSRQKPQRFSSKVNNGYYINEKKMMVDLNINGSLAVEKYQQMLEYSCSQSYN